MSLFLVLCVAALAACDHPEDEEMISPQLDHHDPQTERVAEFLRCTKVRLQPALRFFFLRTERCNRQCLAFLIRRKKC